MWYSIKMLRLPSNELKLITENRGIEDQLLNVLNLSESVKQSKKNFDDRKLRIKKIRKKI